MKKFIRINYALLLFFLASPAFANLGNPTRVTGNDSSEKPPTLPRASISFLLSIAELKKFAFTKFCGVDPFGEKSCGDFYEGCAAPDEPGRRVQLILWPRAPTVYQTVTSNPLGLLATGDIAFVDETKFGYPGFLYVENPLPRAEFERRMLAEREAIQSRYVANVAILITCLSAR